MPLDDALLRYGRPTVNWQHDPNRQIQNAVSPFVLPEDQEPFDRGVWTESRIKRIASTDAAPEPIIDPSDFVLNEQRNARALAVTSLDDNPDEAARATQLAEATGDHPAVVYGNLEDYEAQHKAALTSRILSDNRYLQSYVNSHPLAAKVSNDDYGQLDAVSTALSKYATVPGVGYVPTEPNSVLQAGIRGFTETADFKGLAGEHERLAEMLAANPVFGNIFIRQTALAGATTFEGAMRAATGVIGGASAAAGELYKQLGGNEAEANRLTRDLIVLAQVGLSGQAGLHGPVAPEVHAMVAEAAKVSRVVEPYVSQGKEPPVGIHPVIDEFKTQQAKLDADNLSEALKESVKSATRERSPDLFANYISQITKGEIGIKADAIRELYGDKPPAPDDGILGWVPGLADKLAAAEATGGDVQVPISDWLARVEPEVAKALKDHIRARPEGLTLEEGKGLTPPEATPTEPVGAVRQAAGLQGIQERKLELREIDRVGDFQQKSHGFTIIDKQGNEVGNIFLGEEQEGKKLFVDDIQSTINTGAFSGANTLGPSAMRELLQRIKEKFPAAETLEGIRVSGARFKADLDKGVERPAKDLKGVVDLTKIKPRRPTQLELPQEGTTRIEDREAFAKASAIGMTVDQYRRYQALIEKRAAEDAKASEARAMTDQRKRQTAEWKANRAELRPQVREDITARADVELDEMLRGGRVKLSPEGLTDDQRALLPKDYISADGVHPEDLAGLFGDSSHRELIDRLVALTQGREAAGLKPKAYLERMIDAETDRQMEARYGSLDKNILEEAKDQVLSETQEDLLHEETLARAAEAGLEYSIGKDELKGAIKGFFDRQTVREVSSDKSLAEAGRAGREAEMALLKGDYAEAFRQKQRQYNAVVMANYARRFEKERARFERLADRYKARELTGVEQEYTDWVHDLLMRLGFPVRRSVQDLQESLARGQQKTLAEFVDYKEHHDLREVPVAEFLTDTNFRKNYEELTTADAREVHDSVRALDKNGRDEKKYIRQGEAFDLQELKDQLVESLQRFKRIEYDTEGKRVQVGAGVRGAIRTAIIAHLQVETVFNRLDRFDPKGPWNQFVFRPLVEAANHEAVLEKEFSRKLAAITDDANLKEIIPETIFTNPFKADLPVDVQAPLRMTRKNLRAVLLNAGNESNLWKMAKGYGLEPHEVKAWLDRNATKQDWDWAQKMWDMLKELGDRSATMYRGLTGIAPEKIQIKGVDTPHGRYEGGYYPLIRHQLYGEDVKLSKSDLEGAGYIRATTAAGYTKKRTGAIYPLSLDLDSLPNQIKQIIHDTAYRPAVIEAGKIFYDNKIKNEFKKHLGAEYADMFVPWLKDVANTQNFDTGNAATKMFLKVSDFMRQNAITTLVGLNPSTVMKHTPTAIASSMAEVGPRNFLKAVRGLASINEETGDRNWQFAMKTSEELQRRMRNWVETMGGSMRLLEGREGEFMHYRDVVTQFASKPVAFGDLISAVPTWMARYTMEMEDHGVHGDAVYAANKAVRQAHGSSAITSKSAVARSKPLAWFTGFFTFFNDLFNRQVETLWKAGEALDLAKEGEKGEAMKLGTEVAGRLFAYVIVPAMIEELVSPLPVGGQDNWAKTAAKSLLFTLSSSYVFVREIVNGMLNGRNPSAGLLTTTQKSLTDMHRDLITVKPKPENVIKHGATLTGMLTGLMPAQVGRSAAFLAGKEKPKGPWGWMVGLRYGTIQNHAPTFEKYMKGH